MHSLYIVVLYRAFHFFGAFFVAIIVLESFISVGKSDTSTVDNPISKLRNGVNSAANGEPIQIPDGSTFKGGYKNI